MLERNKVPASESGWDHRSSVQSEPSPCYYDYRSRRRASLRRGEADRRVVVSATKMQWFSHFGVREDHLEDLSKQFIGSHPQSFWGNRAGQGLRICIPTKFPGAAAGLGATF